MFFREGCFTEISPPLPSLIPFFIKEIPPPLNPLPSQCKFSSQPFLRLEQDVYYCIQKEVEGRGGSMLIEYKQTEVGGGRGAPIR